MHVTVVFLAIHISYTLPPSVLQVYETRGMYDSWWNELLIPAGILQWPVYGKNMPKLYNYGALGVNLGHELIRAVDEIGKSWLLTKSRGVIMSHGIDGS